MDRVHFAALHAVYAGARGCILWAEQVYRLVGGAPGHLPTLCGGREAASALLESQLNELDVAVGG